MAKEPDATKTEPQVTNTEPQGEPSAEFTAQPQAQPGGDALTAVLTLMQQQTAAIAAMQQQISAMQNQQKVNASILSEPNGGEGIPNATNPAGEGEGEGEEDYPEIDLESIGRMIGDY